MRKSGVVGKNKCVRKNGLKRKYRLQLVQKNGLV